MNLPPFSPLFFAKCTLTCHCFQLDRFFQGEIVNEKSN